MTKDARYQLRLMFHARLSKGGYAFGYDVLYEGQPCGQLSVARDTRQSSEVRIFSIGDQEFTTAEAFKRAHQDSLT